MELFKHIMTAMIVGALLAVLWLGLYSLALALIWLAANASALLVMTIIAFIAGTLFYLLEVPYV